MKIIKFFSNQWVNLYETHILNILYLILFSRYIHLMNNPHLLLKSIIKKEFNQRLKIIQQFLKIENAEWSNFIVMIVTLSQLRVSRPRLEFDKILQTLNIKM